MLNRREFAIATLSTAAVSATATNLRAQSSMPVEPGFVDLHQDIGPLTHKWSSCAGSDRAAITMREDWRRDAARFRKETGLQRVRFHGILDDEMDVWPQDYGPRAEPNFQNVGNVCDGLMDLGLRPWVEISFMPGKLASG